MKSTKLATALALGAITLSVLGTNLISSAAAATSDNNGATVEQMDQGPQAQGAEDMQGPPQDERGGQDQQGQNEQGNGDKMQRPKLKNVTRTVTNLENGVQVTCTSSDAATVAKLQSMKHPDAPKDAPADITVTHSNITNGIQVTITSTNADTVKKIQAHEKNGGRPGMGQHGGQNGQGQGGVDFSKVQKSAANLENGATITLTSTDSATVSKIQDFAKNFRLPPRQGHGPRMGGRQSRQGQKGGAQGQQGPQGQNDEGGPNEYGPGADQSASSQQ